MMVLVGESTNSLPVKTISMLTSKMALFEYAYFSFSLSLSFLMVAVLLLQEFRLPGLELASVCPEWRSDGMSKLHAEGDVVYGLSEEAFSVCSCSSFFFFIIPPFLILFSYIVSIVFVIVVVGLNSSSQHKSLGARFRLIATRKSPTLWFVEPSYFCVPCSTRRMKTQNEH
jgi:hypothetical protein